jgi:tetratricopeptide (TPR) repeat protein
MRAICWRRQRRLPIDLLMTVALLAAAGCAELQPGLARDWAETNALKAARDDHGGYLGAADDLMGLGEYELALRGYTRAIAEVGLSGPVIGGLGAANLQLERHGQARTVLDRGTRIEPQSVSVWNNLGVALAEAGERRAAHDAFALARSLAPTSDPAIPSNLDQLQGKKVPAPPATAFQLVRHKTGLFLILEGSGGGEDTKTDDAK